MVPVGEGRAKVVTPLTDIQLLHPVTATMLEKGERGKGGRGEGGRKGGIGNKREEEGTREGRRTN